MKNEIDLVVYWVDGNDPAWKAEKQKYLKEEGATASEVFYRDWGLLRYWFRGVERNMPWIRKVHFVTWGHLPQWLNTAHPKLNIVRHKDYIPHRYLPTFSANPIEINLHRIEGLAECFIIANDDMYFMGEIEPTYYFQNELPCDCLCAMPITEMCKDGFGHILWNNMSCINRHFSVQESVNNCSDKWFSDCYPEKVRTRNRDAIQWQNFMGFGEYHYPIPVRKSVFEEIWSKERKLMEHTSMNRFRSSADVSNWLMRYWQLASGQFTPYIQEGRVFVTVGAAPERLRDTILSEKNKVICINEGGEAVDFETRSRYLRELFELRFPEMSSYEKF